MRFSAEQAQEIAILFSGLAHPVRLQLIGLLLEEEHNVSELMRALDLPQARVSRHLQTLRRCGCCTARQENSWVYYSVRHPRVIGELLRLADGSFAGDTDAVRYGGRHGLQPDQGGKPGDPS